MPRVIQVDWGRGRLSGTMTAQGIPQQAGPVTTLGHGEIINMQHGMTAAEDLQGWSKFPEFAALRCTSPRGLSQISTADIDASGCIFMRWKEHAFLSEVSRDPGPGALTIAGFYYVMMARASGRVTAWYSDPSYHPLQRLALRPVSSASGQTFGSVAFA